MVPNIEWEDLGTDDVDLSGDATGWGLNLSSDLKLGDASTVRLQAVYGEGIQNYMNDAPVDVSIENNPGNAARSVEGKALPLLGVVAFLDQNWNDKWSSTLGYSIIDIDNSDAQAANAFKRGHYALANLMYYPVPGVMMGPGFQWGRRENNSDGWEVSAGLLVKAGRRVDKKTRRQDDYKTNIRNRRRDHG